MSKLGFSIFFGLELFGLSRLHNGPLAPKVEFSEWKSAKMAKQNGYFEAFMGPRNDFFDVPKLWQKIS